MLYSLDLRIKVMHSVKSGMKKIKISKIFSICRKTIYNWINLEKKQGNLLAITGFQKGHSHKIKDYIEFKNHINNYADYTQEEIALYFNISPSTVGRALNKIGYSKKKKSQTYKERSENKRAEYLIIIEKTPKNKRVYLDESGMNDNDFYPHAYSKIGERYYEPHSGHYSKRISMIAGLNNNNLRAPFMFEGHCNTKLFEDYIDKILVPTLNKNMVVIMDNASFHKSLKIIDLINTAGCKLIFLPPYSPDLNPIEHHWHKIKTCIRKQMRDTYTSLSEAMEITLKNMCTC